MVLSLSHTGGELAANDLLKTDALPASTAQESVSKRQRVDAAVENLHEFSVCCAITAAQASAFFTRWSSSAIKKVLVLLCLLAIYNVNIDSNHP
jgi:hypothetical protein